MKRNLSLLACTMMCASTLYAQNATTGTVRDEQGYPMPGVTVQIANSSNGTITDIDGNFSIMASPGDQLIISFIGYQSQTVGVADKMSAIAIQLQTETQKIDEVVVTAIGIKQQKKKLGYSTQQVSGAALEQPGTLNVGNALSGQVAGLTVYNPTGIFQSPGFELRGKSPLIVVDGIPVETDMFDITSEDVQSVNVLKGTSASALYGSRGKNGAILLTTKSATKEGLNVSVSMSSQVSAGFTVYPETQTQYGSGSNGAYEFWDGADGGISDGDMTWGPKFVAGRKVAQWNSPIRDKQTGDVIEWYGDVAGSIYDDKSRYERVPTDWVRHDNLNDFLQTGIISNASFNIAYKGKKSNYYLSGTYNNQQGQVPNTEVQTGGLNFNSTFELAENVHLTSALSYNKVYSPNYPRYGYGPKNHMYTILIWMGDDVNGKDLKKHMYRLDQDGYRQANYNYAWYNNPYFATYELNQIHNRDVINGQMKLNWDILPNLSVQGRMALRESNLFEDMQVPKSYMNYGDSREGDYKLWNTSQTNLDMDMLATYSHYFSNNAQLTINAGGALFSRILGEQYQTTDGLIVPYVYNLGNSQGPVSATNSYNEKQIRSIYGSVNLDLYNAVFLTVTGRNDWTSTLPKGNNSYFYPSVALSTVVSEYIPMPSFMDYLKVSAASAMVSSDLDPYSIIATYQNSTMYSSTPSVTYPSSVKNSNLKPEKTTSYEVGMSTAFLKNRIMLDASYYYIKDENQIIELPISEASGFTSRLVNGNEYETRGLEVVLGAEVIKNKTFRWDIISNWSSSVKKITKIYGDNPTYNNLRVGDRADSYYATRWQRSADGNLIIDANSGLPIREDSPTKVGHTDPNLRFGFQNTFRIKGFRINIDFDGVLGGVMYSRTHEKMWWGGKHPNSVKWRDDEYEAGKPVYVPAGVNVISGSVVKDVNGNVVSDTRQYASNTTSVSWQTWCQNYPYRAVVTDDEDEFFANCFDRSYIKLRRVAVSYDIARFINNKRIRCFELSAFGNNLCILKKIPYVDPDFGVSDSDLQDPSARYVGVSASIKF